MRGGIFLFFHFVHAAGCYQHYINIRVTLYQNNRYAFHTREVKTKTWLNSWEKWIQMPKFMVKNRQSFNLIPLIYQLFYGIGRSYSNTHVNKIPFKRQRHKAHFVDQCDTSRQLFEKQNELFSKRKKWPFLQHNAFNDRLITIKSKEKETQHSRQVSCLWNERRDNRKSNKSAWKKRTNFNEMFELIDIKMI